MGHRGRRRADRVRRSSPGLKDRPHAAGNLTPGRCVELPRAHVIGGSLIANTQTFQNQLDRLVVLGYPAIAGLPEDAFRELLEPLRSAAEALDADATPARVPYVVVVTRDVVPTERTVPLLRLRGPRGLGSRPGRIDRNHAEGDLDSYHPIEASTPPAKAYLLVDVERGEEFCNERPEDATAVVLERGRSPLTIDEGIALVTQFPPVLEKNKCFMLAGSRRHDRRVPALWISELAPKLGWCWDGNRHTWLGLASAGSRRV